MQLFLPAIIAKYLDGHIKAPVFVISFVYGTESSGANIFPLFQATITNDFHMTSHQCHELSQKVQFERLFFGLFSTRRCVCPF